MDTDQEIDMEVEEQQIKEEEVEEQEEEEEEQEQEEGEDQEEEEEKDQEEEEEKEQEQKLQISRIITHSEHFHCDEVFACALLLELGLVRDAKTCILRTRDQKTLVEAINLNKEQNLFVVDVGLCYDPEKNLFDHHQAGCRELYCESASVHMSSFGMVYKKFCGRLFANKEDQDSFYFRYVAPIDGSDNGIQEWTSWFSLFPKRNYRNVNVQDIISCLNTPKKQSVEQEQAFLDALEFARTILLRWISEHQRKSREKQKNEELFHQSASFIHNCVILLKKNVPYHEYMFKMELANPEFKTLFVVLPRGDTPEENSTYSGPYQIHTVETKKFVQRAKILAASDAKALIGENLRFVHDKRFIAVTNDLDSALLLALASARAHFESKEKLILIASALIFSIGTYLLFFL